MLGRCLRLCGRLRLSRIPSCRASRFRLLPCARLPLRRRVSRRRLQLRLLNRHRFCRLFLLLLRLALRLRLSLSGLLLLLTRAAALPGLREGLLLRQLPGLALRLELGGLRLSQGPLGLLGRLLDRLLRHRRFRPLRRFSLRRFSLLCSQPRCPLSSRISSSPLLLPLLSDGHFGRCLLCWRWR